MQPQRNCIAIKAGALLACLAIASTASAEAIGKVVDASGLLLARTASGSIKVLVTGSDVGRAETLFTRSNTYVRLDLTDHSSITLGPDTELSVTTYAYHATGQDPSDSASLRLNSGQVRINSGQIGAGAVNHFTLVAGATTVDIGRSAFIAAYSPPIDPRALAFSSWRGASRYQNVSLRVAQVSLPPGSPTGLAPGLYVQVIDGVINLSNTGGAQTFNAGQFGFVPGQQTPPVILPKNPGMQFTPPPAFNTQAAGTPNSTSSKANSVDCEVR